jgi:hypothetical protein
MFVEDKESEKISLITPKQRTKKSSIWQRPRRTSISRSRDTEKRLNGRKERKLIDGGSRGLSQPVNTGFFIESKSSFSTMHEVKILKADLMERPFMDDMPVFDDPLMISILKGYKDKLNLLFEDGFPLKASNVAELLHCDIQEVENLRIKDQLLGVMVGQQEYFYPRFQLEGSKILKGLEEVLKMLKDYSSWTQLMFLKTGDIRLDGKTPLEVLQKGDIEKVVATAKCYGVHGAA